MIMVSRQVASSIASENLHTAILKVYGKQCGQNFSPTTGETQILFCPFALFEELKDKFEFLQKDEKFLYSLILQLPFETQKEELEQNLRELIRLDFK